MVPSSSILRQPAGARIAVQAVQLISLARLLNLLPTTYHPGLDFPTIKATLDAFANHGIGRQVAANGDQLQTGDLPEDEVSTLLSDVMKAIEQSPLPMQEWEPIHGLLGDDLLEKLVATSTSSVHRYRTGERTTPDNVAARLHFVTLIVADLLGSYNDFGIRRWFGRKRTALSGRSPQEILAGDWDPDDDGPGEVKSLAATLLAPSAT
ncbi:hypothetical protein CVV68_04675 [Arthrobacter livingstonensis]|uniref:Antitoxin Xre/MbcA/ParS-like toxin-binding domain-containing protein n=1 Tax=Arthrobacter livingstonensis TaxID=670078 RepID=A0A2V5LEM2_9MICC|nr:hypothetical protein [Arthrobacter livingstonensis]PYI69084.1 hypothetical protein CVV68_04675 [Arthrobacter livingstonensis]